MKRVSFDEAFDRLIGHEGGYVNDPADPGGETKWGISKRSYPYIDIKSLTREDAKKIYLTDFWIPIANSVPSSVSFQLFDFAVNSGIQTAIRHLQRALGVADDGYFGPISREAARQTSETDMLLLLNAERLDFMTRLRNWNDHGRGWARRIAANLRYAAKDS
jgi:lysozyme family protein